MHLAAISTRNDLPLLLRGPHGGAAEIGTHRGDFAAALLRTYEGRLYCVDHWDVPPGYERQAAMLEGAGPSRLDDHARARGQLDPFGERAELWRATSREAAARFVDGSLDFAYLDADHERPAIDLDLALWWPKVRPGGLLAGHDFLCVPGEHDWGVNIQPAALAFAESLGLPVFVIPEAGGLPFSFYLEKPEV